MAGIELIIFDCDGVLVDSERIANEVFARILREEFGWSLSLEQVIETFVGHSSGQCMEIIERKLGRVPPEGLEQRYLRETEDALARSVVAVHGIEEVLLELSVPFCVASSGSHRKMRTTLGKSGLLARLEGRLHSTSDVARGKPYPDVYLYAAQKMGGYAPERCLVVEDTPLGVRGGVAAGMFVFGYAGLIEEEILRLAGAHRVFRKMSELPAEIKAHELAMACAG